MFTGSPKPEFITYLTHWPCSVLQRKVPTRQPGHLHRASTPRHSPHPLLLFPLCWPFGKCPHGSPLFFFRNGLVRSRSLTLGRSCYLSESLYVEVLRKERHTFPEVIQSPSEGNHCGSQAELPHAHPFWPSSDSALEELLKRRNKASAPCLTEAPARGPWEWPPGPSSASPLLVITAVR